MGLVAGHDAVGVLALGAVWVEGKPAQHDDESGKDEVLSRAMHQCDSGVVARPDGLGPGSLTDRMLGTVTRITTRITTMMMRT